MKLVLYTFLLALLVSCASATLTTDASRVRFVGTTPTGCAYLGEVVGTPGGMSWGRGGQVEAARANLKNRAGELGANVVEISGCTSEMIGTNCEGEAYRCPEPQ